MAKHEELQSIHKGAYVDAADPGAVGAGKLWIQLTGDPPYQLRVRNDGDDGWERVGIISNAGGAGMIPSALVEVGSAGTASASNTGTNNPDSGAAFHPMTAAKAIDASETTCWGPPRTATPEGEWLQVDLGAAMAITAFRVVQDPYAFLGRTLGIDLQSSPDASAWTTRHTLDGFIDTGEVVLDAPVTARYWRLLCTVEMYDDTGDPYWEVYLFELFTGEPGTRDTFRNEALPSRGATADAFDNPELAIRAIDGDPAFGWSSSDADIASTFTVDLGAPRSISRVILGPGGTLGLTLTLASSPDGTAWTDRGTIETPSSSASTTTFDEPHEAQHWRLTVTAGDLSAPFAAWQINRLELQSGAEAVGVPPGHTIADAGGEFTQRFKLTFLTGLVVADDPANERTTVSLDPSDLLSWQGAWDNAVSYSINDVVLFDGSSYVALASTTGDSPPTSPTSWQLVAQGGTDGASATHLIPLTNGSESAPELIFAGGDVVMVEVSV